MRSLNGWPTTSGKSSPGSGERSRATRTLWRCATALEQALHRIRELEESRQWAAAAEGREGFDRNAYMREYMREYMRKRRAKAKARKT